jgi:hypothetical protein
VVRNVVLTVSEDTSAPLLILDYPGRRPEASLSALRLEDSGYRTLSLPAQPLPVEVTGRAYAQRLVAIPGTSASSAVVAYCAASAIAVHVAHLLYEQRGWAPALVFLDATPTSTADVTQAYATAIRQVPGSSGPPAPGAEPPELPEQPALLLQEAHDDLSRRAATALRAQGLGEDVITEPVAHFADQHVAYLAYLLAAQGPLPRDPVAPMLQVLSRDHRDHRDWLPGGELSTVRIDSDRAGLATHVETRKTVLKFLDRAVPPVSASHIHKRRQHS